MNPKTQVIINLVLSVASMAVVIVGIVTQAYSSFSIACCGFVSGCFLCLAAWEWCDIKK